MPVVTVNNLAGSNDAFLDARRRDPPLSGEHLAAPFEPFPDRFKRAWTASVPVTIRQSEDRTVTDHASCKTAQAREHSMY